MCSKNTNKQIYYCISILLLPGYGLFRFYNNIMY